MRKLNHLIALAFFLFISAGAWAQTKKGADYFAGSWNMLIKGTPQGDARMILLLDKKDTTLTGTVQDSTGKEMSKVSSLELKDTALTVNFTAQGYDVYLFITRKDDDHVVGKLMDMFDAEGDRIKNGKQ